MTDKNYMPHISEDWMGMCNNKTINDGMGEYVLSRADTVKQYKKSKKQLKK